MIKPLLSSVTLLLIPAVSSAYPGLFTDTPIELKPISQIKGTKFASVCFLGVGDCGSGSFSKGDSDYNIAPDTKCLNEGFVKINCTENQEAYDLCPYDSAFGKGCSCKSEYQYSSSNCSSPRYTTGSSCGGKYTGCSCPSGVPSGSFGCAEYYAYPCSSVCKRAKSDNCDKRTAVNAPYGCMTYWSDCSSKCQTAYPDNCRSRNAVTCPYGCASYWGDCAAKCSSCDNDNCKNRTAASCSYGCSAYWSDCSSKCNSCFPDNCRNRTAVSLTPHGCAMYYSDCPSKCEVAFGTPCHFGDVYYTDGTCVAADYHVSNKKILGVVVYVTDDGNHGQIMTIDDIGAYVWATVNTQLDALPGHTSWDLAPNDYDSCGNTAKILSVTNSTTHPAVWAAKNYAPENAPETRGKWCLPAIGVIQKLVFGYKPVPTAIAKIGGSVSNGNICSSSPAYSAIWNTYPSYSLRGYSAQTDTYYVRPVLEF